MTCAHKRQTSLIAVRGTVGEGDTEAAKTGIRGDCREAVVKKHGCIVVSILAASLLGIHCVSPDGICGVMLKISGTDSTEYLDSYSVSGFRSIRRGMSETDVLRLVGEPMERIAMRQDAGYDDGWQYRAAAPDAEGWNYSRSKGSSHYRLRVVVFRERKVVDMIAKVYID